MVCEDIDNQIKEWWWRTSRSLLSNSVPRPAPVPPPNEWMIWKPCNMSHVSACFLTTSCCKVFPMSTMIREWEFLAHENAVYQLGTWNSKIITVPLKSVFEITVKQTFCIDCERVMSGFYDNNIDEIIHPFAQLFPAPVFPVKNVSGLKRLPKEPPCS